MADDHPPPVRQAPNGRRSGVTLDETSKKIIKLLQADGRRSYAALGKAVGLSEAAVRQRVQRLLESGVMQGVAVTDPLSLGMRRMAMIGLRTEGDVNDLADHIAAIDEVEYMVISAGSFDFLIEVVVADDEALLDLISR